MRCGRERVQEGKINERNLVKRLYRCAWDDAWSIARWICDIMSAYLLFKCTSTIVVEAKERTIVRNLIFAKSDEEVGLLFTKHHS